MFRSLLQFLAPLFVSEFPDDRSCKLEWSGWKHEHLHACFGGRRRKFIANANEWLNCDPSISELQRA